MAGALLGAIYAMTPEVGLRYTLFAFFVVVLAGLGSVVGVMAPARARCSLRRPPRVNHIPK